MCRKDPSECKAKTKCTACIKRQEMSKIRNAYLEAKEKGEVKSYKIVVDKYSDVDYISNKTLGNAANQLGGIK